MGVNSTKRTSTTEQPHHNVAGALIALCHRRWSLPVIAQLHRTSGAKFVALVKRLGASRDSLAQTLRALAERGWVTKNSGYGHPMRPEYLLTSVGQGIGPVCDQLMRQIESRNAADLALKKWSLPVLWRLTHGDQRFGDLKDALAGITPRALTQTLKDLQGAGFVDRDVADDYPPQVRYRLTSPGRDLGEQLIELADRLGPSESEQAD